MKGELNLINIEDIKNNVSKLSKNLPSLNIDSIFIEQNENIKKFFIKMNNYTNWEVAQNY